MIDFHAHCLPAIDDGASNAAVAVEMLADSKKQGIDLVVATPHFYANGITVDYFLEKRDRSFATLMAEVERTGADIPEIILASEVRLGYSVLELDDLDRLCIGNSGYMLVEMPYEKWEPDIYELLYTVMIKYRITPVMAHIERYIKVNKKIDAYRPLFDLGVKIQANAEGFLNFSERKFLSKLIDSGNIHVIGSDMHNMADRKSRYNEAVRKIEKKFGVDFLNDMNDNAEHILNSAREL